MAKKKKKRPSVTAPLDWKGIRRETKAKTRLQYGEFGRQLRGEMRKSQQDTRNTRQWYRQYRQNLAQVRRQNTRAFGQLDRDNRAASNRAQSAFAANRDRLAAEERESAQLRGVAPETSPMASNTAAEEQRRQLRDSYASRTRQMGASSSALLNQMRASSAAGRAADVRAQQSERRNLREKKRELAREKGDFRVATRGDLIRGEREWKVQRWSAADAAGKLDLDRQAEARRAAGGGSSSGGGSSGGGKSGGGGAPPKEVRRAIAYTRQTIRATPGATWGDWRGLKGAKTELIDGLINRGVSPAAARAAYNTLLKRWRKKRGGKPSKPGRGDYR